MGRGSLGRGTSHCKGPELGAGEGSLSKQVGQGGWSWENRGQGGERWNGRGRGSIAGAQLT